MGNGGMKREGREEVDEGDEEVGERRGRGWDEEGEDGMKRERMG